MSRIAFVVLGSLFALGLMLFLLGKSTNPVSQSSDLREDQDAVSSEPLMIFCAASNRAVMEKLVEDYANEYSRQVDVQFGPSQTLLSQMEVSQVGDLYLPADDSYLDMAQEKELVDEVLPIAKMQGVIAVKRGNPKSITRFSDLLRKEVRLVQADPDAAAIGKVTRRIFRNRSSGNHSRLPPSHSEQLLPRRQTMYSLEQRMQRSFTMRYCIRTLILNSLSCRSLSQRLLKYQLA